MTTAPAAAPARSTMPRARIALLVLEALPNAGAVRSFVAAHSNDIVLVGLSDPMRPSTGGTLGQLRRHLARSGPRFVPYLAVNFALPDLLRPLAARLDRARPPLRRLCESLGIPTIALADVNGAAALAGLRAAAPDILLTFHFDQILSAEALAIPRLGAINVHPALLPRHRGPVPTLHALAEGAGFGVTVHRTAVRIDAGAILAQAAVPCPERTTATRAAVRCHEAALPLLDALLDAVAATGQLPEGTPADPLPYAPFPPSALLADMARRGLRLVDARDLADSLRA